MGFIHCFVVHPHLHPPFDRSYDCLAACLDSDVQLRTIGILVYQTVFLKCGGMVPRKIGGFIGP